jgi:hypothetical protein
MLEHKGLRYNSDKIRFDLLEPFAIEHLGKVFTDGARKYEPRNWQKGMSWTSVIASLKRHINKFEQGEDYDAESGNYHMAHVAWNALALLSYYKLYPQGDDRPHEYLHMPRTALDIDDVLADFTTEWCKYHGHDIPTAWQSDRNMMEKFANMIKAGQLDDFYLSLPVLTKPEDIPFEPIAYVTSRPVSREISEQWLDANGFPQAPVYSVGLSKSKVEALRDCEADIFVDDFFGNFVELNKAGICTYLFDRPHNHRYDVGHKRIKTLGELIK